MGLSQANRSTGPGLIHSVKRGPTIDHQYYINNCLKSVIDEIRNQRSSLGTQAIKLHYNNGKAHIHGDVVNYLESEDVTIMPYPPNSPDLAPCDFWLFDLIKQNLDDQDDSKSLTHGPGAVFPLSSAQQHLSLLVYHHQGSPRHWYIIPAYERDALTKILQRENSSICFEHQKLLINPLLFDKYHIRYHRLVQYQNEFVVLSAGALTQSFTEDASWNESIPFALPSWIDDGHAHYSDSTCQCCINSFYEPITIDVTLFKHELIQEYIETYLNIDNDGSTSINKDFQ
ncbi:unnamed protein product [Rotaria sordida]|uniref:JmjC domain-containing protein n=1 Tax=Rotaria sordida TaxID=392033 RepID=A0A819PSS0_9BILA|nr:unnamed protein product [Rotaria sordida]CAF4017246.1 unnamed protein product [Rotaria sordida]